VRVKGISMTVPENFVPLEADRQERLRAAALAEEPRSIVTVDARRAASGMGPGTAYVLRLEAPKDPRVQHGTVRDMLRWAEAELRLQMKLRGTSESFWDFKYEADRLDGMARATMTQGTKSVVLELRTVVFITPDDRVVSLGAQCMAESSRLCEPLLRAAVVDDEPRRAFDEIVGPAAPRHTTFAGFEFGSGREAFRAACRKARHAVDRFDWPKEPPGTRAQFDAGRLARCSGSPAAWDGGNVQAVAGHFEADRLVGLTMGSSDDIAVVQGRLVAKHADGFILPDAGLIFVDLLAEGGAPYVLEILPAQIDIPFSKQRAKTVVNYYARSAFDALGR
jgi:hypothetical protein